MLKIVSLFKDAISDIEIAKGTLNDVFITITGRRSGNNARHNAHCHENLLKLSRERNAPVLYHFHGGDIPVISRSL